MEHHEIYRRYASGDLNFHIVEGLIMLQILDRKEGYFPLPSTASASDKHPAHYCPFLSLGARHSSNR